MTFWQIPIVSGIARSYAAVKLAALRPAVARRRSSGDAMSAHCWVRYAIAQHFLPSVSGDSIRVPGNRGMS